MDAGSAETDAGSRIGITILKMAAVDEAEYLQLAETLAVFRSKRRVRAEALDIAA